MAPCPQQPAHYSVEQSSDTTVVYPDNSPAYVRCHSSKPFVNPTTPSHLTPDQINQEHLNLNLGQSLVDPEHEKLLRTIRFLNNLILAWWEHLLFKFWNKLPVALKRFITFRAWNLYLPLHRLILVSVQRMRFSLAQLTSCQPNPVSSRIEKIDRQHMAIKDADVPPVQKDHCRVEGLFAHVNKRPTEYTIFWLYGGAFLSGDSEGNLGPAEKVGRASNMDVFIPTYRLVPEAVMDDLLWDVCLAYHWLCQQKGRDPSKILLLGMSSGAALCTRLMQFHAEHARGEELQGPAYVAPLLAGMPGGAVLLCPYVDYAEPASPAGSFSNYHKHDLIVNKQVMDAGLPFLDTHLGGDRKQNSPVHRSFRGLPPLCVVVSEHEVVYDQATALVNRARSQGVEVTLGVWKYMCHAFCFLNGFVPEAEESLAFAIDWLHHQSEEEEDCI